MECKATKQPFFPPPPPPHKFTCTRLTFFFPLTHMFYSNDNFQRQKILTFIAFYSTDLNQQTFPLYIVILTHEENNFKKTLWKKVKLLKISPLSTRFSFLCNLYFKILLQPHFSCLLFHSDMHFHTRFACCGTMAGLFIGPALLAVVLWQVFSLDPLCLLWYYGRSFHWTRFKFKTLFEASPGF